MNWYKRAQMNAVPASIDNQVAGIISAALNDAYHNPSKPVADLTYRLSGQSPQSLQSALSQAMAMSRQSMPGELNEAQMSVVKQVQQIIHGSEGTEVVQQEEQPPTPVDGVPDLPPMQ